MREPSDHDRSSSAPLPFAELMALKQLTPQPRSVPSGNHSPEKIEIEIDQFESIAPPYAPGLGARAFGGHVYAQSAYAASKTVPKGFVVHSITGTFILPGRVEIPYIYTVRHLRDGAIYLTRAVDAQQNGQICFSCLCSFKRAEDRNREDEDFAHQPTPAQERFRSLLQQKPTDHPVSPSVDADWWTDQVAAGGFTEAVFPGLDVRKVDMAGFNACEEVRRAPERYRQLTVYSLLGSPSPSPVGEDLDSDSDVGVGVEELRLRDEAGEFDNLYACAHMYSSDRNSLFLIPRALGIRVWSAMASLTLTVVFHQHGEALRMIDWGAVPSSGGLPKKWFIQEAWTPRSGENRAVHESWLWSPEGTLLATSYQDSMLRLGGNGKL